MVLLYVWFRQLYYRTTLFDVEGQTVFTDACPRSSIRCMGVYVGVQLRHVTEMFQCLPVGLQQSTVELVWFNNSAVFPGLVRCKFVARISFGVSVNTF